MKPTSQIYKINNVTINKKKRLTENQKKENPCCERPFPWPLPLF